MCRERKHLANVLRLPRYKKFVEIANMSILNKKKLSFEYVNMYSHNRNKAIKVICKVIEVKNGSIKFEIESDKGKTELKSIPIARVKSYKSSDRNVILDINNIYDEMSNEE